MGISIKHTILFLVVISSVFISLPEVKGGCAGGCAVSGGGGSSSSFMGDPAVNIDMSSFDEFVRDNLGGNSSLNQTSNGNSSQSSFVVMPLTNNMVNTTSDNRTVKLGGFGMQDNRLSTLTSAAFNNNIF